MQPADLSTSLVNLTCTRPPATCHLPLLFSANLPSYHDFDLIKGQLELSPCHRLNWILCPASWGQAFYLPHCSASNNCTCNTCEVNFLWHTLNSLAIFSMRKKEGGSFAVTRGQFMRCPALPWPSSFPSFFAVLMTVISAREYLRIAHRRQTVTHWLALNLKVEPLSKAPCISLKSAS